MENEHVLSGLIRKRAEIAGRIAAARAEAEGLAKALESLEATIRLFVPDAPLPPPGPAPPDAPPRGRVVRYGGLGRATLDALREAAPLPTRDLAARVMTALGINAADRAAVRLVHRSRWPTSRSPASKSLTTSFLSP